MEKAAREAERMYRYTQNRELSWLRFDRRVLEEAGDDSVPLLERLKYVAIFSTNLDEFFMVRVGRLLDLSMAPPGDADNAAGPDPKGQLEQIYRAIPELIAAKDRLYTGVMALLRRKGIVDLQPGELTAKEREFVSLTYRTRILPVLSPQIVGGGQPFPHLANKELYVAALLRDRKGRPSLGLIPVPAGLPPYLAMPGAPGRFIRLETVVRRWGLSLFSAYQVEDSCVLSVTRNADIGFAGEAFGDGADLRDHMSRLLRKRAYLRVVRLEISRRITPELMKLLRRRIRVERRQIYVDPAPLNMRRVYQMISSLPEGMAAPLSFPPYRPRWPEDLAEGESVIDQVRRGDKLLFYPFDQVDPFLRLLREAAERPDVLSIRISVYRLASASKIARLLCRAAENGKEVTVVIELRARFDEANNIAWSRVLEDAGCRVIYGAEGRKCHGKICLITLRRGDTISYITQIGTGNYNETTSALYTDLSLLTASESIGRDGERFFQGMLCGGAEGDHSELLTSPGGIKKKLLELIAREMEKGDQGYICIKANAMTERAVMEKLAQASAAGVQIDLILRGICCLRPGIPGLTEHIHVTSIVGRYLEHARIYCFGRGADAKLYISSADLMTRNLDRRVEIACPVYDPQAVRMLQEILEIQLRDNVKASTLLPDGSYRRKANGLAPCSSQEVFMVGSLHKQSPPPSPETDPRKRAAADPPFP